VPAISTTGEGTLSLKVDPAGTSATFELTFSGLSSSAVAAHIHFAQPDVNGAVIVFLCGGGGKPACPAGGGTVTGTISGADVLGVPAQGFTAGDFAAFLRALRAGLTYTNVHSTNFPSGEIRGQLRAHGQNG
jgi:hypothetical protein